MHGRSPTIRTTDVGEYGTAATLYTARAHGPL
eukprot:SAG11_NODE_11511_length_756_cov_0.785388_1_plen_31_part_10